MPKNWTLPYGALGQLISAVLTLQVTYALQRFLGFQPVGRMRIHSYKSIAMIMKHSALMLKRITIVFSWWIRMTLSKVVCQVRFGSLRNLVARLTSKGCGLIVATWPIFQNACANNWTKPVLPMLKFTLQMI